MDQDGALPIWNVAVGLKLVKTTLSGPGCGETSNSLPSLNEKGEVVKEATTAPSTADR